MKRFLALTILFCTVLSLSAFATTDYDYYYDPMGKNGVVRYPMPKGYSHKTDIYINDDEIGQMSEAEDIFIDGNDNLYIADTGNSRILRLNVNGEVTGVFDNSDQIPFNDLKGVFASNDGSIYAADNGNNRIVHMSQNGKYIEEFVTPDSELLAEDFTLSPSKIAVSDTGYIYLIRHQIGRAHV